MRQVQTTHAHQEARACPCQRRVDPQGQSAKNLEQQNKKPFIAASRERPIGVYRGHWPFSTSATSAENSTEMADRACYNCGCAELRHHIPPVHAAAAPAAGQLARSLARLRRKRAAQPALRQRGEA